VCTTTRSSKCTTWILPSFVRRSVLALPGPDKHEFVESLSPILRDGVESVMLSLFAAADLEEAAVSCVDIIGKR